MDTQELRTLQGAAPPHNTDAERSVLGALLQDKGMVVTALELLRAEDFYEPAHQAIYSAIQELNSKNAAVDLITLSDELARKGTLDGVGGLTYLTGLLTDVPTTLNTPHYIRIVREKSTLRKLIAAAGEISRMAYAQQEDLSDILSTCEKLIFDISMSGETSGELEQIREVLKRTYAKIEELSRNKGKPSGVPTGFYDLDKVLTGLHGGELVLVGARPSMGKTSFAINIADYAAHKGFSVAVFSLEMPREQIAMRMLCGDARVSMQQVRSGLLKDEEWMRIARALGPLANTKVFIDDTSAIKPSQLRSRCRRLMMDKGLDLIVVDYLQLMTPDSRIESREQQVSEISRRLKSIALELKVPLIACAQLSRANVQRAVKKPMLSDLRDSGSIEQDADVVMFLHRESYYDDTVEDKSGAEVIVAKQRNGPLEDVKLAWLAEYTLFANLAEQK